jgi:hypothetical protein
LHQEGDGDDDGGENKKKNGNEIKRKKLAPRARDIFAIENTI